MCVRQEQACGLFGTFTFAYTTYIEYGISIGEEQVSDNASNKQLMRCIMRIFSSSSPSSIPSISCMVWRVKAALAVGSRTWIHICTQSYTILWVWKMRVLDLSVVSIRQTDSRSNSIDVFCRILSTPWDSFDALTKNRFNFNAVLTLKYRAFNKELTYMK